MYPTYAAAVAKYSRGNNSQIQTYRAPTDGDQFSQCSTSKSLIFSKTPVRPVRPSHSSLATIGRASITLWPWGSKKEGLGFSPSPPTREGTPEPSSVSASKPELVADTKGVATSTSTSPQTPEPSDVAQSTIDPTPLPPESADDSILAAIQSPLVTEDHYGFLREMGLNYGFPYITNTLEIIMENVHIYTGTDWWATIALSAIAVRCLMVVPMAISSHHMAKMELIKPYTMDAQERLAKAKERNDPLATQEAQKEVEQIMKAVGYKMIWPIAPMVLQGLFGYCAFKLMRAMTALPVPGLENGGALWFLDLTVRDPLFILPVTLGGLMHLVGRMGGETAVQSQFSTGVRNSMLYYVPVLMAGITAFQPAALQVSFLTAMMWGVGQGYLFKRAWFREFFNMEPLPDKSTQSQQPGLSKGHTNATGNIQARLAPSASGKPVRTLRTVSPIPLKYEAPRARAQREMANFHPPKEVETKKPAAPSKGILQTMLADAQHAQEQVTGWVRDKTGLSEPSSQKDQRAEEYEQRRRMEKKYEAQRRRQGRQ